MEKDSFSIVNEEKFGGFNPLVATIFCMILETVTRILRSKEASQVNSSKTLMF